MGLDMYLYAERPLPADFDRTGLKFYDEEGTGFPEAYVSDYEFMRARADEDDKAEASAYRRVLEATGLGAVAAEDTPSAMVIQKPDGLIAHVTVGYWRKANAIHAWFVEHVQGGVDECQLSDPFGKDTLRMLAKRCKTAMKAYSEGDNEAVLTALAPRSGFFFGSTAVDEWYAHDVKQTQELVERLLKSDAETFYYRSSW